MNRILLPAISAILVTLAAPAFADPLEQGFNHPPDSARPQTWWHWMNGNITKTGISLDLQAMKQIGLGGATIVNADCGIPPGPVRFMSPQWQDDFKFAVQEANRLGLNLCVENCAGWSSSGGPWMTVTNAMQKITTSERQVTGPADFNDVLPQPPTNLGFYRDIAVLAFPAPSGKTVRISHFRAKAGYDDHAILSSAASTDPAGCIPLDRIRDLTRKLNHDGRLRWRVPRGKWIILRVGYTPTGVDNHPAPPEGTGLECDKLSKAGLDAHWKGFMQKALDDVGPLAGRGKTLNSSLIDSYETGDQNWTADF
ncbi:MAG: glycosyl hydrolase, partial [Limisphaerales bacterium]